MGARSDCSDGRMDWTDPVNGTFLKRRFLVYFVNSRYSFWKWPRLISNPLRTSWVILRQSPKALSVFFSRRLWIGGTFPWLPESQACVPFETLPSSSLRTTFLKPEQSLPSPQREKWWRLITSLRAVDCGLFTGGYIFRHRNNSSPANGGKPNGIRSHRHPGDGASASRAHAKPQSSWWPRHLWKEPWRRFSLAAFLVWSVCRCHPWHSEAPPVQIRAWLSLPWPQATEAGEITPPMAETWPSSCSTGTRAQLITGQQGLGCPQKSRHRNPHPVRGQQQKMSCYN